MAIKTYSEQLEEVQTAITEVLTSAQEYWYQGRRVTRANLDELRKYETYLREKVDAEINGTTTLAGWG